MDKFKCSKCNNDHKVYTLIDLLEPDVLYMMSDEERKTRVYSKEHIHFIDKQYYLVKSLLLLPIQRMNFDLRFKVWVRIERDEFIEFAKDLSGNNQVVRGELYSVIPNYLNAIGNKVKLHFDLKTELELPNVELIQINTSLYKDAKKGIDFNKYIKWMESIYH